MHCGPAAAARTAPCFQPCLPHHDFARTVPLARHGDAAAGHLKTKPCVSSAAVRQRWLHALLYTDSAQESNAAVSVHNGAWCTDSNAATVHCAYLCMQTEETSARRSMSKQVKYFQQSSRVTDQCAVFVRSCGRASCFACPTRTNRIGESGHSAYTALSCTTPHSRY
jgi:hypothetical protein